MALPPGSGFSPNKQSPAFSGILFPTVTVHSETLTTSGGAQTLTATELLGGLLVINTDDAQTLTLPAASAIHDLIPAVSVGTAFYFDVINDGDTTLTIAVGTGITALTGTVLTIVANASKRFLYRVTAVATQGDPTSSDTATLYGFGSVGAATT